MKSEQTYTIEKQPRIFFSEDVHRAESQIKDGEKRDHVRSTSLTASAFVI